ncbi:hypothetical protein TNCV_967571 [Trichonephila clavipes]|nr:hypothetical protein TNCV_967571 [Trichonephila clavipes]
MYGSTCRYAGRRNGGVCLSSIKHVVFSVRSSISGKEIARRIAVKITQSCCLSENGIINLLDGDLGCFYPRSNHWEVGGRPQCDKCGQKKQAADSGRKSLDTRHRRLDDRYLVFTVARRLHGDESRFSLSSDFHRILIWREQGSRNPPSNIIERDRYGGRGVLVWEASCLVVVQTFTSSTQVQIQRDPLFVTRFFFHMCVFFRGAMGLQFLFMDDNAPCHHTVAAEQLLRADAAAAHYLTTSNDSGASICAAKTNGQQCLNNSLTPSFSAWADAVKPAKQSGEIISATKDRMYLCWTHHRDVSPSVALRSMLLFQSRFFLSLDFSFSKCCSHYMSLRIGDLTVLNVLIWKAFVQSYIEKRASRP